MTDDSQDHPVLSSADRTLLKSAVAPTDAQLEATRRALRRRVAALSAGAVVSHAASTAEATGAATTAAMSSAATTAATATTTQGLMAIGAAKWISAGLIVTAVAGGTVVATRQSRSVERPHTAASVAAPAPRPVDAPAVVAAPPEPAAPSSAPAALAPSAAALSPNEARAQADRYTGSRGPSRLGALRPRLSRRARSKAKRCLQSSRCCTTRGRRSLAAMLLPRCKRSTPTPHASRRQSCAKKRCRPARSRFAPPVGPPTHAVPRRSSSGSRRAHRT